MTATVPTFALDRRAPNIFPSKYRQVAVSDEASLDLTSEGTLRSHYIGREAYMQTRFIVVRCDDDVALVEVLSDPGDQLFSPITDLRLLAGPDRCRFVQAPNVDVGIPSQLAPLAGEASECLIVEGKYSHISFLMHPVPLHINVLDIVPPGPSKLADQLLRILDTAEDLPPIIVTGEEVDSGRLLEAETDHVADVLLPCRGPGVDIDGSNVSYLDQRPAKRDWTLLGCHRSAEIHRHFYGVDAPRVDTCPRRFLGDDHRQAGPTLSRCCLLQHGLETGGRWALVPWGASLHEVRLAVEAIIDREGFEWTPT